MPISKDFCFPTLEVKGLKLPNIFVDRAGVVHFGCISVHIDDFASITDQQIRDCAGQENVDWWNEWKGVLIPFFRLYVQKMDDYWANADPQTIASDKAAIESEIPYLPALVIKEGMNIFSVSDDNIPTPPKPAPIFRNSGNGS